MRGAARKVGVDQLVAIRIVQMTLDTIIEVLATEGRLELRDFGVFEVYARKARKGRNPRTGEEVMVPERRRVVQDGQGEGGAGRQWRDVVVRRYLSAGLRTTVHA